MLHDALYPNAIVLHATAAYVSNKEKMFKGRQAKVERQWIAYGLTNCTLVVKLSGKCLLAKFNNFNTKIVIEQQNPKQNGCLLSLIKLLATIANYFARW